MPEQPPVELVAMLERLGLATAAQVARMGRHVRRLARDLPRFESVWVDALLKARVLTPFQAAEINAGRGQGLRVGPYVLYEKLPHPYYVACYRAKNIESKQLVRLAVVENAGSRTDAILRQLESLAGRSENSSEFRGQGPEIENPISHIGNFKSKIQNPKSDSPHPNPLPKGEGTIANPLPKGEGTIAHPLPSPLSTLPSAALTHVGADANRIFAASPWMDGRTAAEWMVHHGRFPPEVVLEIARTMLAGLMELDKAGVCHGDVSVASLVLTDDGDTVLPQPGLRAILRPEEGYAHADLLPEAYDSLAPERILAGTPSSASSDIYACGCVWWHLLCGRPLLAGGDSLAKLRAAQAAESCDVRRYAFDVPPALASAIGACLEREPSRRPESFAKLAAMLGPPTRGGKEALADCLARAGRPSVRWTTTVRSIRKSNRTPLWLAGAACGLATVVALLWPVWRGRQTIGTDTRVARAEGGRRKAEEDAGKITGPNALTLTLSQRERGLSSLTLSQRERGPWQPALSQPTSPDNGLVPTAYQQPVDVKPADFVLGATTKSTALPKLRAGQCVHGPSGKRAAVLVSPAGLIVDRENVRFENIDFIWRDAKVADSAKLGESAFVRLAASRAEFRGCSFQSEATGRIVVPAIRWEHPRRGAEAETSLPSGRLLLSDCLLRGVGVGLDCHTVGALGIELKNTLHLNGGPLLRLDHCPRPDEAVSIVLTQVTLRGGGPLLECLVPHIENQPGEITVQSVACAFAPEPGVPLVRLTGEEVPERLLNSLRWTGQGSLVALPVPMVVWRGPDGRERAADESTLSIAGLVRSEVGFAGDASDDPNASRLVRWQAPLQSADTPGVDPASLPVNIREEHIP